MTGTTTCGKCGALIKAGAAGGLCPRCLMALNFESRTMPAGEGASRTPPLSPEEMRDRFPQFEILECLGRGGMGVVYKARQKALDRVVAIKLLAGEWQGDPGFAGRFEHEAKTLAQMSHPNIVTVHDFGEAGGLYFIVMEYVDGVNLRDLLREGKMAPEQALAIVPPVCEALEYAHGKGVVHRDIKPENVLLDREGRVKIADFGIASLVGGNGEKSGTPPYMAPEQETGSVDKRADIYALGVVLYEMLTGERPTKDVVAPSRKVEVDVRIDEMVLRALEKEPERRYQTAEDFRTAVETISEQPATDGSVRNRQRPDLASWSALWFGFLSAAIPTIFYWFQPWAAPWLTPGGQEFMLNLTLVVALLAVGLGIASRKSARGTTAIIMGGISLTIWMLFFIAGQISSPGTGGGILSASDPTGREYTIRGNSARFALDGDAAVVRSGRNSLRFEHHRIMLDGYQVADLPKGIREFEVAFPGEAVRVRVDGVLLFDLPRENSGAAESLGPVVMRTLGAGAGLDASFLDLETGRVSGPPEELASAIDPDGQVTPMLEKLAGWIRETGVDALFLQDAKKVHLLNGRTIGYAGDFDAPDVGAIRSAVENIAHVEFPNADSDPSFFMTLPHSADEPVAVFRTREGTAGILEIMNVGKGTTTLRYRLVHAEAATFLPEKTVVLSDLESEDEGPALLDFDRSLARPLPAETFDSEAEGFRWMASEGFDLVVERVGGRWGLLTPRSRPLHVVARLLDTEPPELTPAMVAYLLAQVEDPGLEVIAEPGGDFRVHVLPEPIPPSLLLAFRTADGQAGVMRIEAAADGAERLKLRYRLIQVADQP